jgi:hypothetical protein
VEEQVKEEVREEKGYKKKEECGYNVSGGKVK